MLDIGISKLMIVGGIALIVIGPERLPKVARMLGTLVGRAQRYVSEVKAEVNRSIELEELQKMKSQFETAARDVETHMRQEVQQATQGLDAGWAGLGQDLDNPVGDDWSVASPAHRPPRKNWRLKRSAVPNWFKQRTGVRRHAQSGAARVARFRPPGRGPGGASSGGASS